MELADGLTNHLIFGSGHHLSVYPPNTQISLDISQKMTEDEKDKEKKETQKTKQTKP